jgi:hypothetical protein
LSTPRPESLHKTLSEQNSVSQASDKGAQKSNRVPSSHPITNQKAPLEEASRSKASISDSKLDYVFGRATGREHNLMRTAQNAQQMARLGIHDTLAGRSLVRQHLSNVVEDQNNILRRYTDKYGSFEIRESFLAGPSGQFSKLESTWEIMLDGSRRLTTIIPYGGPKLR